jgi:hypothetical protein
MIIFDYVKSGEVSLIKFGMLSLLFGLTLSYTDPIIEFKFKDLFATKSAFLRLTVLIVIGQIIALILLVTMGMSSFVALLLASSLAFIGSHRGKKDSKHQTEQIG